MFAQPVAAHPPLERLPLVTLYATDRCNSRCVTCDYWKHGKLDMSLQSVMGLLPSLHRLATQVVLLSGGEPLLNPQWPLIAELLRANGLKVWLLTSGLSLAKHARRASLLFDNITVSMDGTDPATYAAIRGLDAFDKVCEGIQAAAAHGCRPSLRVTLQRANYRQLPGFVDLARSLGARSVSFLGIDIANAHAFGRTDSTAGDLALHADDLGEFARGIDSLEHTHAKDFRCGFIAESPRKLRRILQYFTAINGLGQYPAVLCNAPEFSAVVGADGRVQPCFFIAGPPEAVRDGISDGVPGRAPDGVQNPTLEGTLNGTSMSALRAEIRAGQRAECVRCVCTLWRDPRVLDNTPDFLAVAAEAVL